MRLDKYLADMGVGTRSDIKKMIRAQRVTVNGDIVRDAGYQLPDTRESDDADSRQDLSPAALEVCVDGTPVRYESCVYYLLNKPAGVLSAAEDRRQTTVVDLIRDGEAAAGRPVRTDLFPVGRLDKDTEGLLLITNDGQLTHQLLSPRHHVDKTYYAKVSGIITPADAARFRKGIRYDTDLVALPADLTILSADKTANISEIQVTIQEGKFHQVRKMVAALGAGKEVLYLRRTAMGPLTLDPSLSPGDYRRLTGEELSALRAAAPVSIHEPGRIPRSARTPLS